MENFKCLVALRILVDPWREKMFFKKI